METEDVKIRQFLLGNAAEKDADEIGLRIFTEPDFDEEMLFAEERLIEDFLNDGLTAEENEFFKQNFLTSPARVELFEEISQLRTYAQNHFGNAPESERKEKSSDSWFENLKRFLSLNLRPIAAVLIVLMLAGIGWRVFLYDASGLSLIEKDYAALNAKDLNNAPENANLSDKSLISGTFRDTTETSKLTAANLTDNVLFRLALPSETPKDALFNLELTKNGQTVFKQTDLRVYQNQSGQELKVILPKSVLSKGNYQIKLNNGTSYGFAVE